MIVDRRTALAGLAGTMAAGAMPAHAATTATILVTDTRLPTARAFLAGRPAGAVIDLAGAHADLWREVRGIAVRGRRVAGLTRWSDWIAVRGVLLDRGLRVRAERPIDAVVSGDASLFYWEMV